MEDETRETRTSEAITHLQRTHTRTHTPPKGAAGSVYHPPLSISLTFSLSQFLPPSIFPPLTLQSLSGDSHHSYQMLFVKKPVYPVYITSGAAQDRKSLLNTCLDPLRRNVHLLCLSATLRNLPAGNVRYTRNISKIRSFITFIDLQRVIHAFITSHVYMLW